MTVVAIHQPTFLPWLGWWDKLTRADVFILLDGVQFPKTGGNWINRVRILVGGEPAWVTVPVDRSFHGVRSVRATLIDDARLWRAQIEAAIAGSYGRSRHFRSVRPVVEACLREPTTRLAELNERAIRRLAEPLGVDTGRLVRQSELGVTGSGTELLVDLCRAAGGDAYLSGDGAGDYLVPELFAEAGLGLVYQEFTPPRYPQASGVHVPGLSIVDALMNCGWDGTAALIGARPATT